MVVLDQVLYWLAIVATAMDVLLLVRVLQLRLQRIYLFITLVCVLGVFFDAVQLWFGINSDQTQRVDLYSRFLYAFLYPLAAWDVFEEVRAQISKLLRTALGQLISGLLLAALFGFLITLAFNSDQEQGALEGLAAYVLWAGSSTATLGFFWTIERNLKKQQFVYPPNTFVWMRFFELTLVAEVVACFGGIILSLVSSKLEKGLDIVLALYGISITIWCVLKLKKMSADVSTPANADAS